MWQLKLEDHGTGLYLLLAKSWEPPQLKKNGEQKGYSTYVATQKRRLSVNNTYQGSYTSDVSSKEQNEIYLPSQIQCDGQD